MRNHYFMIKRTFVSSSILLALAVLLIADSTEGQTKIRNACRINQFRCSDGSKCLAIEKLCNGRSDCPGGEDERGTHQWDCSRLTVKNDCDPQFEYQCRYGCIAKDKVCNGVADCWGGFDESEEACTKRRPPQLVTRRPSNTQASSLSSSRRPTTQFLETTRRPTTQQTRAPSHPQTQTERTTSKNIPSGYCRPIHEDLNLGFMITCETQYGKPVSCTEPVPHHSTAIYKCRRYFSQSGGFTKSTTRECTNGQWSPRRSSFSCNIDCGVSGETSAFVTGGITSREGKWPWHMGLYQEDPPNSKKWALQCGGSLISPTAVLTAAHCVTQKLTSNKLSTKGIIVAAGKFLRNIEVKESEQQIIKVRKIEVHEDYNHYDLYNDIAIIFLETPVQLSDYVRPVCLPSSDDAYELSTGTLGRLVGWGRTSGGKFINELQEAQIPVVASGVCKDSSPTFSTLVRPSTFCAGYQNGTSACDGDSGGGLVFPSQNKYKVHGIVSAGVPKTTGTGCSDQHYAVFTRVVNYEHWINVKIDRNSYNRRK